jgi:hypothetical protein
MDIIFTVAIWYKEQCDNLFAMMGIDTGSAEGIIFVAIMAICFHILGEFFGYLADRCSF